MVVSLRPLTSRSNALSEADVIYAQKNLTDSTADSLTRRLVRESAPPLGTTAMDGKLTTAINELRAMEANWDSHGAPQISPNAAFYAFHVARTLTSLGLPLPHLKPIANGGIQVAWYTADLDFEIDVNPGGTEVFFSDSRASVEWFGAFGDPKIVEFVNAARHLLTVD